MTCVPWSLIAFLKIIGQTFVILTDDVLVLFHGWLIYSCLQIYKLIKGKWLPGDCADWSFDNIMTWSYCLHRRYSMSGQKNNILINEHALNREPVPLIMTVPLINSFYHSNQCTNRTFLWNREEFHWDVCSGVSDIFFSVRGSKFRQITFAIVFIETILSLCNHKRWLEIAVTYANKGYRSPICYSS